MCAPSWSNSATSCSRPMKLLHYVSQAPHTNICNSIMHKDLQNAAISLNESNSWRRLTTKDQKWLQNLFLCVLRDTLVSHASKLGLWLEQISTHRDRCFAKKSKNNNLRVKAAKSLTDVTRLNFFKVARAAFFSKYSPRHEVRRSARRPSPLTMIKEFLQKHCCIIILLLNMINQF